MDITDIFNEEELKSNVLEIEEEFKVETSAEETEADNQINQAAEYDERSDMTDNQGKDIKNAFFKDMMEYSEKIENMNEKLEDLNSRITDIFQCVSEISGYKSAVEKLKHSLTISQNREEKLEEELERYKKGEYYTHIRPFIETMVDFYKEFYNSKNTYIDDKDSIISDYDEKIYDEIIKLHDFMLEMLENRMSSHGLRVKSYKEGSDLNVSEQTVRKKEDINDAQKEGKVAHVLMPAFIHYDKVISKATVSVYKCIKEE